jgi:hypothetical protein
VKAGVKSSVGGIIGLLCGFVEFLGKPEKIMEERKCKNWFWLSFVD